MSRIGLIGNSLMKYAALALAAGQTLNVSPTGHVKERPLRKLRNWWSATHTTSRQPRNPADPIQAARIEAASAKRARRAEKLRMTASALPNRAHLLSYNRNSLNPFYIAR